MPQNRRDLLASVAQLSAATAPASLFPHSIQRALSLPANRRAGTVQDVRHVVILMMENRGFDHYFGTLRGVRGFGDRHPVPLESGKPVWFQSDGTRELAPYHLDIEQTFANHGDQPESFALESEVYAPLGKRTVKVSAHGAASLQWDVSKSGNWYDLTLKSGQGFTRRFAGWLETGKNTVSDPATGAA